MPARRVRRIPDWIDPLDGCPRCGYAYKREDGYFLLAIWGVNYGVVGGLGFAAALLMEHFLGLHWLTVALIVCPTMALAAFAFARHAKALFLAFDHYFDPHLAIYRDSGAS